MGTNYYARILPTKERKEKLKKLIDEDKFHDVEEQFRELYEDAEIHLGKRSAGWKFLFNPNYEKYYPLTRKGLMDFLKQDNIIIYNEYFKYNNDRVFKYTENPDNSKNEYLWTPEQFMNMALNWGNNPNNPGWSGKEYEEWEQSEHGWRPQYLIYGDSHEQYWRDKGYNPEYHNFFNDDMRWSTCCEFS